MSERIPLTVVIPAYGRWGSVERAAEHAVASEGIDAQIRIVDDASPERPPASLSERFSILRLGHNAGPAEARNAGAREAATELVAFVDSDVFVHPDTLGRLARRVLDGEADCACGVYSDLPVERSLAGDYKHLYLNYCNPREPRPWFSVITSVIVVRAEALRRAGGFDPTLRQLEDLDFSFRLRRAGCRNFMDAEALADHDHSLTVSELLETGFARGRAFVRVWAKQRAWELKVGPDEGTGPTFVIAALALPMAFAVAPVLPTLSAAIGAGVGAMSAPFLGWAAKRLSPPRALTLLAIYPLDMTAIGLGAYAGALDVVTELVLSSDGAPGVEGAA